MSDQGDLRLNELNRYRKTSGKLALEVHSHCEVPAGCGGAVLRWRRPGADIGFWSWTYVRGTSHGPWIDGKSMPEQRTTVSPGKHVLSLIVDPPGPGGFLLFSASLNPHIATALRPEALSQANGQWRATPQRPPDDWQLPGFDDSGFQPLIELPVPAPSGNDKWRWETLQKRSKGLGLPSAAPRVWVRWTFHLDLKGFS
jgi:hypothetical protein